MPYSVTPVSPALSVASTADGEIGSSPILPPLPAPLLSEKALDLLRTPPRRPLHHGQEDDEFVIASWGSPYTQSEKSLCPSSSSSGMSDDLPIHQLDIVTPFLRPRPESYSHNKDRWSRERNNADRENESHWDRKRALGRSESESHSRRIDGRNHSGPDQYLKFLQDLSSAPSSDPIGHWTSRASSFHSNRPLPWARLRNHSSTDTIRQDFVPESRSTTPMMDFNARDNVNHETTSDHRSQPSHKPLPSPPNLQTPWTPQETMTGIWGDSRPSGGTSKEIHSWPLDSQDTPRPKKKIPWKGKNILVLLPRDGDRGRPGKSPFPLSSQSLERKITSWAELGHHTDGFDLCPSDDQSDMLGQDLARSKGCWPDQPEVDRERREQPIQVTLPDLTAWRNYVNEINEAKLRALGVTSTDGEPAVSLSVSPSTTNASRQAPIQYPPLAFSPPIPSSSASRNIAHQQYQFGAPFVPSGYHNPALPTSTSPALYATMSAKFNPRHSVSFPAAFQFPQAPSPQSWTHRRDSPSLVQFSSVVSPNQPLQSDGFPFSNGSAFYTHQRTHKPQYPTHQKLPQPWLQELREADEETIHQESYPTTELVVNQSPSKSPEPFVMHSIESLQAEIDDAEYHLEEQLRNQLEHEDYSPHNDTYRTTASQPIEAFHLGGLSSQSSEILSMPLSLPDDFVFRRSSTQELVLHHPRPHSQGHSLSQSLSRHARDREDELRSPLPKSQANLDQFTTEIDHRYDDMEIDTNSPGHHQRSFSTMSNPWHSSAAFNAVPTRRPTHANKFSVSKLNVQAPEFKLNTSNPFGLRSEPSVSAGPGPFEAPTFRTSNSMQSFHGGTRNPLDSSAPYFMINAAAPTFLPGNSDFIFTSQGPKFRPDAPAFTPSQPVSNPVRVDTTSPVDEAKNKLIFDGIDLTQIEIIKPAKKSKAIPIVPPSPELAAQIEGLQEDSDGHPIDESRIKRCRGSAPVDDVIPLFALPHDTDANPLTDLQEVTPIFVSMPETGDDLRDLPDGEEIALPADVSILSSTAASDPTDANVSVTSLDQSGVHWEPSDLDSKAEARVFSEATSFLMNDKIFAIGGQCHKRSLSAAAAPFVPNAATFIKTAMQEEEALSDSELNMEIVPKQRDKTDLLASPISSPSPTSNDDRRPFSFPRSPSPMSATPLGYSVSDLVTSRFATPLPPPQGLGASRFASGLGQVTEEPDVHATHTEQADVDVEAVDMPDLHTSGYPATWSAPLSCGDKDELQQISNDRPPLDATFAEIDAVMNHITNHDPTRGVKKSMEASENVGVFASSNQLPEWHQPSPNRHISLTVVTSSPVVRRLSDQLESRQTLEQTLEQTLQRAAGGYDSPLAAGVVQPFATVLQLEDPFVDLPRDGAASVEVGVHRLVNRHGGHHVALPTSEWDCDFSEEELNKLDKLGRGAPFIDGRVNHVVSSVLRKRLEPLEKSLAVVQDTVTRLAKLTSSFRHDRRSTSAELQDSDADDEDDEEPAAWRSASPHKDKRLDQIKSAVMEAVAIQYNARDADNRPPSEAPPFDSSAVLRALEDMKDHFGASMRLDFRGEDLSTIVENAVERKMASTAQPSITQEPMTKIDSLRSHIEDLEHRLHIAQQKIESEVETRRVTQDHAAETNRKLQSAETRVEVEIINRSVFDQRVADLEEKLRQQEERSEVELDGRRAAEDKLSEVQRLLRIATEEESRLRNVMEERDMTITTLEKTNASLTTTVTVQEANQIAATHAQIELKNRMNAVDGSLRSALSEAAQWRAEADRVTNNTRKAEEELGRAAEDNRYLRKVLDTVTVRLQETERIRESWREKYSSMQEDLIQARRDIVSEESRRTKNEDTIRFRHEAFESRLLAEAKTRDRMVTEIERLERVERQGIRAISECKRTEGLLDELRTENHALAQKTLQYQRELDDTRASSARDIQREQVAMQAEMNEVNQRLSAVRDELETQNGVLRAEIDSIKLAADMNRAQHEMLLEESQATKDTELAALRLSQQNDLEDLQARHERQLNSVVGESQKSERHLLERLSLSTAKSEHLQERVLHLEERLEIAHEAAQAAVQRAKAADQVAQLPRPSAPQDSAKMLQPDVIANALELPGKVSPQALRESILVLQEQLQHREHRIEHLEETLSQVDPDAASKIAKRDDEIIWLRELLAVRHSDLQDIIAALSGDECDPVVIKDAAIRLKANLQMEEQERERAINGGSAITLPNIAQSLRVAATPRAQEISNRVAAAWGNWRKSGGAALIGVMASPIAKPSGKLNRNGSGGSVRSTPSRASSSSDLLSSSRQSLMGGLIIPPTSISVRGSVRTLAAAASVQPPSPPQPVTPPPMARHSREYDSDAQPGDFDDADFFLDD